MVQLSFGCDAIDNLGRTLPIASEADRRAFLRLGNGRLTDRAVLGNSVLIHKQPTSGAASVVSLDAKRTFAAKRIEVRSGPRRVSRFNFVVVQTLTGLPFNQPPRRRWFARRQ